MPRERIRAEIKKIGPDDTFTFNCHPGVPCFTECCRSLELALTPYDVARLRKNLGMDREDFLARHTMVAVIPEEVFPQVMLAMDEKNADRCPFVSPDGCRVYPDRPAACRTYPLGRGISMDESGTIRERFVTICENHCRGFAEPEEQTPRTWLAGQELAPYNHAADLLFSLRQKAIARGFTPDDDNAEFYLRALYLDPDPTLPEKTKKEAQQGGEEELELLKIRIRKVAEVLFGNS